MIIISTLSSFSHTLSKSTSDYCLVLYPKSVNQFFDRKLFPEEDDGCPYPTIGCENSYVKQ